ncbi:hypothetical protein DFP73DRAFT_402800 [Morchella snyderi]|nr:hypothetical protein DFP73DRAFT_402800 [Morchella snyderi]
MASLLTTSSRLFAKRAHPTSSTIQQLLKGPQRRREIFTTPHPTHPIFAKLPTRFTLTLRTAYNYGTYAAAPVVRTFDRYGQAQRKRPYVTQLLTSIAIYALGDLNAQFLFGEEGVAYDPVRTGRNIAIGGVFSIPSYLWFKYLGESFNFRSKLLSISTRVLVNQIFFTPVFLAAFFTLQSVFSSVGTVSTREMVDTLKKTIPTAYINSCKLWPAVTAVNFWFVPLEFRALFGGAIAVGWNGYLSFLSQRANREDAFAAMEFETPAEIAEVVAATPAIAAPARKIMLAVEAGVTMAV